MQFALSSRGRRLTLLDETTGQDQSRAIVGSEQQRAVAVVGNQYSRSGGLMRQ